MVVVRAGAGVGLDTTGVVATWGAGAGAAVVRPASLDAVSWVDRAVVELRPGCPPGAAVAAPVPTDAAITAVVVAAKVRAASRPDSGRRGVFDMVLCGW